MALVDVNPPWLISDASDSRQLAWEKSLVQGARTGSRTMLEIT